MQNAAKTLVVTTAVLFGLTAYTASCGATLAQEPTPAQTKRGADADAGMSTKAVVAVPGELIGKSVVTLEGTTVGEVSLVRTDPNGELSSIDAEIGGFLGIGETTITVLARDFAVSDGVVVLAKTEDEVNRMAR